MPIKIADIAGGVGTFMRHFNQFACAEEHGRLFHFHMHVVCY